MTVVGQFREAPVLSAARRAGAAAFVLNGLVFATWVSRIPTATATLSLAPGQLGLLLLSLSGGAVVALPVAGQVEQRLGAPRTVRAGALVAIAGLLLVGTGLDRKAPVTLVAVGLFALGAGSGLWDVAMNVHGAAVEQRLGRHLMPRLHAGFSLGTVAGAVLGAAALQLGLSAGVHLAVVALATAGAVWFAVGRFLPTPPPVAGGPRVRSLDAWREPRTLALGALVLAFAFTEGTANEWTGLAVVDGLGARPATGALAFGVFVTAMTAGRWYGTPLLDRYGRIRCLQVTAALALAGLLMFVLGAGLPVVLAGAVLWGFGASLGFPVGMSAAADDPRRAGQRVAVVSTIGYLAFLGGPPLIGLLADHVGVRDALLAVVVALVAGALLARTSRTTRA